MDGGSLTKVPKINYTKTRAKIKDFIRDKLKEKKNRLSLAMVDEVENENSIMDSSRKKNVEEKGYLGFKLKRSTRDLLKKNTNNQLSKFKAGKNNSRFTIISGAKIKEMASLHNRIRSTQNFANPRRTGERILRSDSSDANFRIKRDLGRGSTLLPQNNSVSI